MSEKKKESIFSKIPLFKKLKSVKNIEIIIALIFGAIIILIYLSSIDLKGTSKKSGGVESINLTSASEYTREIEDKLSNVLSSVRGAGTVKVFVMIENSSELIIAKIVEQSEKKDTVTKDNVTTSTSDIKKTEEPLIVGKSGDESPLILLEVMPKISGILIVATGAGDTKVKLDIMQSVQAVLGIQAKNIEILEGE